VRFLDSAGGAMLSIPSSLYHAAADPLTEQEKAEFQGHSQIPGEVTAERLSGAPLVRGAQTYANPATRPTLSQAASVLPEALGQGVGSVAGGEVGAQALKLAGRTADIAEHPAFQKAMASIKQSAKPAVRGAARAASDIVDPELTGVVSPRLAHAQRVLGRVANALEDNPAATQPVPDTGAPIERDATLDQRNIPEFAGEEQAPKPPLVDMQDQLAQEIAAKRNASNFTAGDRLRARSLLEDSLKSSTADVVDSAIPGKNAAVKAKVDFYLQKGDVGGAEQALDQGAKQANPAWQPPNRTPQQAFKEALGELGDTSGPLRNIKAGPFEYRNGQFFKDGKVLESGPDIADAVKALDIPQGNVIEGVMANPKQSGPAWQPLARQPVPTTNEIRARVQAEAKMPQAGSAADIQDTRALQQEMNWDLQRHGWGAESEARREFIARNSTGMTKGQLGRQFAAQKSGSAGTTAPAPAAGSKTTVGDLTSILQQSLDAARKGKAQQ